MSFTAKDVAILRGRTGCGMMGCKKVLTEPSGDMDAAVDTLKEKDLAAVNKKSGRITAEGVAYAQVNVLGNAVAVIEINAETDFVVKDAKFQAFVKTVVDTVEEQNPADMDVLLDLIASGLDKKVDDLLKERIQTISENIKIRRFIRMEGPIVSYAHTSDRIDIITQFGISIETAAKPEFQEYTKNIAIQIVVANLSYLNERAVPANMVGHEKKIPTEQIISNGKPVVITEKIVIGRLSKFLEDICLVDQVYVKDSGKSVQQYTDFVAEELGGGITTEVFACFKGGKGLEKKEDDFAGEVASMVK